MRRKKNQCQIKYKHFLCLFLSSSLNLSCSHFRNDEKWFSSLLHCGFIIFTWESQPLAACRKKNLVIKLCDFFFCYFIKFGVFCGHNETRFLVRSEIHSTLNCFGFFKREKSGKNLLDEKFLFLKTNKNFWCVYGPKRDNIMFFRFI